jgi:DNA-directed RNA polymerase I subunit RPA49
MVSYANQGTQNLSRRTALGLAFGTKKSRKAIAAITENAITTNKPGTSGLPPVAASDALSTAVLESIAASTKSASTKEQRQIEVDEQKPRPKANLDALTPRDVYPISMLVGNETMKSLLVRDWQDKIENGEEITAPSRFVITRIIAIAKMPNNVPMLKVLRYTLHLIEFYKALKKGGRDGRKLPRRKELQDALGADEVLVGKILKKFAPKDGSSTMNKWHIDNLLTHIAALALTVDDFSVDMADLKEDMKLELLE